MTKFIEELEDRLIEKISQYDPNIERVEVIDCLSRDILPMNLSWVGATVIPRLESMKDMWIMRERYIGNYDIRPEEEDDNIPEVERKFARKDKSNEFGIKYLKEKIPF
jgi:actin-related protein 8